jgi:hypothetical protein
VPDRVPVLGSNATPAGSVPPLRPIDGGRMPSAVTAKVPASPTVKTTAASLVNDGGWRTVSVAAALASDPAGLAKTAR